MKPIAMVAACAGAWVLGMSASMTLMAATPSHYQCPPVVHLASARVAAVDVAPGFQPFVSGDLIRLSGVSMYAGPPSEGAALEPASATPGATRVTWKFIGGHAGGKWLSCDYAQGVVRLAVEVDETVSECVATVATARPQGTLTIRTQCR